MGNFLTSTWSGTFATKSKDELADSTSRPSFNLYWPSSVNFIEEDVATCLSAEITGTDFAVAKTEGEAGSEHGSAAELSLPQTQPEYPSQQIYNQLGNGEIRLLKLYCGDYEEDLFGELQIANFRSQPKPEYEALSYTWADNDGDKTESQRIYIAGWTDVLKITLNCANALRRLRYPQRARMLWVDSICINQKDDEERSQQVRKMSYIYATAARVVIYLGEDAKDPKPETSKSWMYERQFDTINLHADFTTLPYFSRTWVIQEVANARYTWCFYGSKGSRLEDFLQLSTRNREQLTQSHPWLYFVTQRRHRDVDEILDLLLATKACLASDPRDKVFALLGLLTGTEQAGLVADYGLTLSQVLCGVTAFTMLSNPWRVLAMVKPSSSRHLPSWVIDWTTTDFCISDNFEESVGPSASNWPKHESGESRSNSHRPRFFRDGTLVLKGIQFLNVNDCFFGEGAESGPPGVVYDIHFEPNYRPERRRLPDWTHESDKLFRVPGTEHLLILRPLKSTNKHNFVAICKRHHADGMAHLLESLDRVTILLVSTWNEILSNEDHKTWFQSQIWGDIKEICALIKAFYQRSTADNFGICALIKTFYQRSTADNFKTPKLSKPGKEGKDSHQGQEHAKRLTTSCPALSSYEKVIFSDMIDSLRRKLQSARNWKSNITDAGMNGRTMSPTTAYSTPTDPTSTPFIGPSDHCIPSLVQLCWDWRKVVNPVVDRRDYSMLLTKMFLHQHHKERDLFWHPKYIQDEAVAPIAETLCKLSDQNLSSKELYNISSGTFLKYLMSQTLSVKAIVLDRIGIMDPYENRALFKWMKMSLNLDQSDLTSFDNHEKDDKPWASSFIELWSQLGLTGTQIEDKETLTVKEDNGNIRREAGTPNVIEAVPAEGEDLWKTWFEDGTRRMLLELVDKTERHLLPLEDLFTSQSGMKRSSGSTEERQWGDVFII